MPTLLRRLSPLVLHPKRPEQRHDNTMAAMFAQNPLMNGPNYSLSDAPRLSVPEGAREHRFDPYDPRLHFDSAHMALLAGSEE